ncbi:hypothetical protein [Marinomonas arenicola]|uniref:Uncharacterized protein n=1 Tax=Marinomonas arenicola TaxID=569601 RepID=A0ABU9G403_9GAMM
MNNPLTNNAFYLYLHKASETVDKPRGELKNSEILSVNKVVG